MKKDSDRAVTPRQRQSMSLHTWRCQVPRSQAAASPSCSTLNWGRAATGKESLSVQGHLGCSQLFVTLWTVACQASLSGGVLRARILERIGQCWSPYPSRALYFLLPWPSTPLRTWSCQNPCGPSSCTTSTPGPHRGKPKASRAASGASPSGRPTCRGGDKTTSETQGWCG